MMFFQEINIVEVKNLCVISRGKMGNLKRKTKIFTYLLSNVNEIQFDFIKLCTKNRA